MPFQVFTEFMLPEFVSLSFKAEVISDMCKLTLALPSPLI